MMAKRQTAKTANVGRIRDNGKPENMIGTLSTLELIIRFALAHVTASNVVAMIALVRDTFGRGVFNKNVGRTTGWRVMEFQNRLITTCASMNPRPTLVQLVFIGACEFPGAIGRIFAPIVPATGESNIDTAVSQWAGVVTLFNNGSHANVKPATPASFEPGIERKRTAKPAPVAEPVAPAKLATTIHKSGARLVRKSA